MGDVLGRDDRPESAGELQREIRHGGDDAPHLGVLVGGLERGVTEPAHEVAVHVAIGLQRGVEWKLLRGAYAGVLGDEAEVPEGPPTE